MQKETAKEAGFWGVALVFLAIAFYAGFMVCMLWLVPSNYTSGFCTALGGQALNNDSCNVDGKVVAVVKP